MLLFADSFSHYSTAQMSGKWSSVTAVTIAPTGGRLRTGAAVCVAGSHASATINLTPGASPAGGTVLTVGVAVLPASVGSGTTASGVASAIAGGVPLTYAQSGLTLLRLVSTNYRFFVTLLATGAIRIVQIAASDTNLSGATLAARTIVTTAPGVCQIARGNYLEVQIALSGSTTAVQLRVNGVPVFSGALKTVPVSDVWTAVTMGGPCTQLDATFFTAESGTATFTDLYVCDGVPTAYTIPVPESPTTTNPVTYVDFSTFLGNVKVEAIFPYADLTPLQFAPSTGVTHFSLIDSPVTDDSTWVTPVSVGNIDQYAYLSPLLTAALPLNGTEHSTEQFALPLLGIQWAFRAGGILSLAASMENPNDAPANGPQVGSTITTATGTWVLSVQTSRIRELSAGGNPTPWIFSDVRAVGDLPATARTRFGQKRTA